MSNLNAQNKDKSLKCSAFCPRCGNDLYIMESGCVCKNASCDWHCNDCKEEEN